MSGGSLNCVYRKDPSELLYCTEDLEKARNILIEMKYDDIAKDVQRLITYVRSVDCIISTLQKKLEDVLHDIEWKEDGDISKDDLIATLEKYRNQRNAVKKKK